MKAAVYCGTKNVYQDMIPSMKSLLIHSDVEKIYFLIEDDKFPYDLPPEVECINVSGQQWFKEDTCPNMKNRCSYMVLLRVVFSKIFPHLDKILTIDNDAIVKENVSELWDLDLTDYYVAGCPEYKKSKGNKIYINMGVAMLNLQKFREDGMDNHLVECLNTYYYNEAEQSAINQECQGHLLVLDSMYNKNNYTDCAPSREKIIHYAAIKGWQNFPIIKKYREIEIQRNIPDKHGLDIIIPYYNNPEGLRATLRSVDYNLATITVVDDCSTKEGLEEIKKEFPHVQYLKLEKNAGQGAARQYGIEHTSNPYITFLDTEDEFTSKEALLRIIDVINKYSSIYIFGFSWLNEENNCTFYDDATTFPGKVISREFLELYNIKFGITPLTSYSNEDRGFTGICNCVIEHMKRYDNLQRYYPLKDVIYFRTTNENSLTHQKDFYYYKILEGIIYNTEHMVRICKKSNINATVVANSVTKTLVSLYYQYLVCAKERPELIEENMKNLKYFYKNIYKQYEKINSSALYYYYNKLLPELLKLTSDAVPHININRFIGELKHA